MLRSMLFALAVTLLATTPSRAATEWVYDSATGRYAPIVRDEYGGVSLNPEWDYSTPPRVVTPPRAPTTWGGGGYYGGPPTHWKAPHAGSHNRTWKYNEGSDRYNSDNGGHRHR